MGFSLSSILRGVAEVADRFAKAAERVNEFVSVQQQIQEATSRLKIDIFAERSLVNSLLASSRSQRELEDFFESDPSNKVFFEAAEARLKRAVAERRGESGGARETVLATYALPCFPSAPHHPDPQIDSAIAQEILRLRQEREVYLSTVGRELSNLPSIDQFRGTLDKYVNPPSATLLWRELANRISKPSSNRPPPLDSADAAKQAPAANQVSREQPAGLQDSLRSRAEALGLPYLVHFTRVSNLASILENGLVPRGLLARRQIPHSHNDTLRLDGHTDATCLSISHPNDRMFAKYRWQNPDQDWVVLVMDRSILWRMNAAFCRHNAADNRTTRLPLGDLISASAFEAMFLPADNEPAREARLLRSDPTDVQAEVLIFETIPTDLIEGFVFCNVRSSEKYKTQLAGRRVSIQPEGRGFFGARSLARDSGWIY